MKNVESIVARGLTARGIRDSNGPVGRFLRITIVVLLVVAVWAILVAPDYDLDPTTLRAKLAITMFLFAVMAVTACLGAADPLRLPAHWPPSLEAPPSILDLTCSRLC